MSPLVLLIRISLNFSDDAPPQTLPQEPSPLYMSYYYPQAAKAQSALSLSVLNWLPDIWQDLQSLNLYGSGVMIHGGHCSVRLMKRYAGFDVENLRKEHSGQNFE